MIQRYIRFPLLAAACLLVAASPCPAAGSPTRDKVVGLAAARRDAFLYLRKKVYAVRVTGSRTIGDFVAADAKVRDGVEPALRGASVVGEPDFRTDGLVYVTVELNTWTLPYDLRSRIRGLPPAVRADGVADRAAAMKADEQRVQDVTEEVRAWAETDLTAEGSAPVRARADAEDAHKEARQQAITNAYAALAHKVFPLPLEADVTIGAFLQRHAALRDRFNGTLIGADLVSESLDQSAAPNVYKVTVSLPGKALMQPLKLGPFRSVSGVRLSPEEAELARSNAIEDARGQLWRAVSGRPLRIGRTVGEFAETREGMTEQLERLCRLQPIEQSEITEDGVAKVYMGLSTRRLPVEVRRLLLSERPSRVTAMGAGLPVAMRKTPEAAPDAKGEGKAAAPPARTEEEEGQP